MRRRTFAAVVVCVAVVAGAGLLVSAREPVAPEGQLYQQIQQAVQVKSYNRAVRRAETFLKAYPSSAKAPEVMLLLGTSQVRLGREGLGVNTLTKMLKQYPKMGTRAEVHEALGEAHAKHRRWRPNPAIEAYLKAIKLYKKAGNRAKQIDLWLRVAELSERKDFDKVPSWEVTRLGRAAAVLDALDKALALEPDTDTTVKAKWAKADYLIRTGHDLKRAMQKDWSAWVKTPYDLKRPFHQAIVFLRELVKTHARHRMASDAQLRIAQVLASNLQQYVEALAELRKTAKDYPGTKAAEQAAKLITEIKAPRLGLMVGGPVLTGETAQINWAVRNIKNVKLAAYRVDLFALLEKIERVEELQTYGPPGRPEATWTFATPDKGRHQHHSSKPRTHAQPGQGRRVATQMLQRARTGRGAVTTEASGKPIAFPIKTSGAYLVVAEGTNPEDKLHRTKVLVLVSRLALVSKMGRDRGAFFSVDALSGAPRPKTELLVQRLLSHRYDSAAKKHTYKYQYMRRRVADNGLCTVNLGPSKPGQSHTHQVLSVARQGQDYALCGGQYWWRWHGYQRKYRIYGYTERPIYRPGQTVHFKQVVRKHEAGTYRNVPNLGVRVRIYDTKGKTIYEKQLVTNACGTVSGSLKLGPEPPLGVYRIHVRVDNYDYGAWLSPGNRFRVEEYKKPEFEVTVAPGQPTYRIGETIQAKITGRYYFGAPVAGAKVHYKVLRSEYYHWYVPWRPYRWFFGETGRPSWWWRSRRRELVTQGQLTTDEHGVATISFPAKPYPKRPQVDQQYFIEARMVDASRREIRGSANIKVTHQAFFVYLNPRLHLYQPGDTVQVDLTSKNPNGGPVPFAGTVAVHRVETREVTDDKGKTTQQEHLAQKVHEQKLQVGADGKAMFQWIADAEGRFKAVVTTKDRYGATVEGSAYVWIAKRAGEFAHYAYRDVELVTDRDTYQAGQTARLLVNTRFKGSYVLLTAEGDDLYMEQVVYVKGRSKLVELAIPASFIPNVYMTASVLHENKLFRATKQIVVPPLDRFLNVKVVTDKASYRPRDTAQVRVIVTDHKGKPVSAEFSLALVDASIYYFQQEFREDIRKFFYSLRRSNRVRTQTSYSFRHAGYGRLVSDKERRARSGVGGADAMAQRPAAPMAAEASTAEPRRKLSKAKADGEAKEEFAAAEVRKEFPDSVFWAAHLKTDTTGQATITVRFPDTLTTWRLTAVAVTPGTRVGSVTHDVVTKKNIIVRLQSPRFYVETDEVAVSAIAHNYLKEAQKVRVQLKVSDHLTLTAVKTPSGQFVRPAAATHHIDLQVPAGGEKRVDFWAKVLRPGEVVIQASALTKVESDIMEMRFPVLEYGVEKLLATSGAIYGNGADTSPARKLTFKIPGAIKPGSQGLRVVVSPSIAGVMLEALPYLFEYPYGCTEQTMSRFLPAVVSAKTLQNLGLRLEDIPKKSIAANNVERERLRELSKHPVFSSAEMKRRIDKGLKRLIDFQHSDGGWGWWKGDSSSSYMTAYVVYGLATARQADVAVPARVIDRGARLLIARVTSVVPARRWRWGDDDDNVRLYMLFSLSVAKPLALKRKEVRKVLMRIYEGRDNLNDYSRALLALVLHKTGLGNQTAVVMDNLEDRARIDKDNDTASWAKTRGWWYWYDNAVEATSFGLKAYLAIKPKSPMVPKLVNWLVRNRQGVRWYSTKDTAFAVYALADYLKASKELDPDLTVTVSVDGRVTKAFRVTKANLFTFDNQLVLGPDALPTGARTVTITRSGRGNCYYGAYVTFFTKEKRIAAAGNELFVKRTYTKLVPKEVWKTRKVWNAKLRKRVDEKYKVIEHDRVPVKEGDKLTSGDMLEVKLDIEAKNNFEYLMFEDPKPAGCETEALVSGRRWGGFCANMELRDEKVAFFATRLSQGKHAITYKLRCEIPGVFHALPCRAGCMYSPFVRGTSAGHVIVIQQD